MHHLPRFLARRKQTKGMDPNKAQRKPRLDRSNAVKYVEYDVGSSSSSLDYSSGSLHTESMEFYDRSSFRVVGVDGEIDHICRGLGLSGPEDFSIPAAAWEAMKDRFSPNIAPRLKMNELNSQEKEELEEDSQVADELGDKFEERVTILGVAESTQDVPAETSGCCIAAGGFCAATVGGGIKGVRPPMLKPPPGARLPVIDNTFSTWDILRDFAPQGEVQSLENYGELNSSYDGKVIRREAGQKEVHKEEEEEEEQVIEGGVRPRAEEDDNATRIAEIVAQLSASCSFTTSNEDDSSSTFTDPPSNNISPNGRFRRIIRNWEKGDLLGRGSFGSVYEGISE